MRVELPFAATALALPSMVGGAKLLNKQPSLSSVLRNNNNNNNNKPLWKKSQASSLVQRTTGSDGSEPDIGILSSHQASSYALTRRLQTTTTALDDDNVNGTSYGMDLCAVVDADEQASCDCSDWDVLVGSFSCAFYGGDNYCFDELDGVCGTVTFGVVSDGQAIGISYCINTTQPEPHSYCTTYQMSADGFVTSQGNFVGSAGNCTLAVDDQVCNACAIQTDCQTQNGKQLPGPGPFDCSNTPIGTSGNQCLGDIPFPMFDPDATPTPSDNDEPAQTPAASPTAADGNTSPTAEVESPSDASSALRRMTTTSSIAATAVLATASVLFVLW